MFCWCSILNIKKILIDEGEKKEAETVEILKIALGSSCHPF
jgi:hypothetical protein